MIEAITPNTMRMMNMCSFSLSFDCWEKIEYCKSITATQLSASGRLSAYFAFFFVLVPPKTTINFSIASQFLFYACLILAVIFAFSARFIYIQQHRMIFKFHTLWAYWLNRHGSDWKGGKKINKCEMAINYKMKKQISMLHGSIEKIYLYFSSFYVWRCPSSRLAILTSDVCFQSVACKSSDQLE